MPLDDDDDLIPDNAYVPLALGLGGLRVGHAGAADEGARRLDSDLKELARELEYELQGVAGLQMLRKVPKIDTITPCEPDGGAWYFHGTLVAVFEAKKQQNAGNAIERWYKNAYRCRVLSPHVSYVTFCRGEGALPNGVMGVALHVAHEAWNTYLPGKNSCWMDPQGFTREFLKMTMLEVLAERMKNYEG